MQELVVVLPSFVSPLISHAAQGKTISLSNHENLKNRCALQQYLGDKFLSFASRRHSPHGVADSSFRPTLARSLHTHTLSPRLGLGDYAHHIEVFYLSLPTTPRLACDVKTGPEAIRAVIP